MRIEIQTRGLTQDTVAKERTRRRLRFVLGRLAGRASRVAITFEKVNRSAGVVQVGCTLRLFLPEGGEPLVVEDLDPDLFIAFDRAAKRLGRGLTRHLKRSQRSPSAL